MEKGYPPVEFEQLALLSRVPRQADAPVRNIFVPVDFSDCAHNAVQFALAVAWKTGATVRLFHAFWLPPITSDLQASQLEQLEADAAARLAGYQEAIEAWIAENLDEAIAITREMQKGFAADLILEQAGAEPSDLIVMGTQGASGLVGNILGSVTSHVISSAKCPVLAVPASATYRGFHKIVYATDWSDTDAQTMHELVQFARLFGSEVHVVHVQTVRKQLSVDELDEFEAGIAGKADYPLLFFHLHFPERASLEAELQTVVDKTGADLVAMLRQNRSFFERLFHSSLTKKMAMHSKVPLLVYRE